MIDRFLMPTIPLYTPNDRCPDASHAVRAPGGYEWWYFDAEDPTTDTQIVAILLHGFVFHPGYLREHFRYLRSPTRRRPVLPDHYPCAYLVIYRGGRVLQQFMTQYPPDAYRAAAERVDVKVGPNTLTAEGGLLHLSLKGSPWRLTPRGPVTLTEQSLEATLLFRPLLPHPPCERRFFSRELAGADHHWVIANPLCEVEGSVHSARETIAFRGRGYHDHNYGTGPIGPGLRRWFWGRAIFGEGPGGPEQVRTFHVADPFDHARPRETHLLTADAEGIEEATLSHAGLYDEHRTILGLRFPEEVRLRGSDGDDRLRLTGPRVIDAAPFYLRIIYQATDGRHRMGRALCEVAYPHRLRWPVLGRMIELSIDRRALTGGADGPGGRR